jgi:hypothetical protein
MEQAAVTNETHTAGTVEDGPRCRERHHGAFFAIRQCFTRPIVFPLCGLPSAIGAASAEVVEAGVQSDRPGTGRYLTG